MKKLFKSILVLVFTMVVYAISVQAASAASLQFDPTSVDCTVSGTCTINVVVDAGSDEILATDVFITYNSSFLTVDSITDGTFLTIGKKDSATAGKIYIAGIVDDPAQSKTGSGILATITFSGIANGTSNLSFDCKPSETTDSNIAKNDLNATDIIQCSDNGTGTVIVGTGTGTGSSTTTPVTPPAQLPRSGVLDEMVKFAVPGTVLLLLGLGLKLVL